MRDPNGTQLTAAMGAIWTFGTGIGSAVIGLILSMPWECGSPGLLGVPTCTNILGNRAYVKYEETTLYFALGGMAIAAVVIFLYWLFTNDGSETPS